jgi:hypothetical protein
MTLTDIVATLNARLEDIRRAEEQKYPIQDEFEMGIDCRLANERLWLETLLNTIKDTE